MNAPEATPIRQSRTGKRPIEIPKGVTVTLAANSVTVKGPKGESKRPLPGGCKVVVDGGKVTVSPDLPGRDGSRMQGLARSLIAGMVKGCSEGYTKGLQLVGTGYRAEVKGAKLVLNVGYSHQIHFDIPAGLKIDIPADSKGTAINLSCHDKEVIGQAAAKIRGYREPEPYGGKGIRYLGEKVREKAGKSSGKGGK
jgi:large subunit ribosomal protein L6